MNVMNNNDVEIDHISHINYDNRKKINLRISNKIENSRNKGLTKRNTSGYTGVSWNEKKEMTSTKTKNKRKHKDN